MVRNENEGLNYYFKEKWKLFVTLFCLFAFITMGNHMEISGSTMLQLSDQVGSNLGELARIVAARSFGYMLSVILFGGIFQSLIKNHAELLLTISSLFPAVATASTPYIKSLWMLSLALLFQGMSQGVTDLGINTLVTTMWKDRSTAPLNCVYLGYVIGALFSIFLVRIFRSNNSNEISPYELIGPYTISAIFCLISSMGFGLIVYKKNRRTKEEKVENRVSVDKEEIDIQSKPKRLISKGLFWKTCSPTTCGEGYFIYGLIFIFILVLFNLFFGGIEQGFTKFFISFIESEGINMSQIDCLYSMIFYWLLMLIGRIVGTFLTALWISPEIMLTISLLSLVLTYIIWLIFLWYIGLTKFRVFALVSLTGLSISCLSPTFIGWIKQYLKLNPIEITYLLTANAFGGILMGLIGGYIFGYSNRRHLFPILMISVLSCSILFILTILIQFIHGKQTSKEKEDIKLNEKFLKNGQSSI